MAYTAVYEREPDNRWTVEIKEVPGCHTYGRTIEQARERVREALGLFVDNADTVEIADDVRLPGNLNRQIQAVKQLRAKVVKERARVAKEEREMVVAQRKVVLAARKMNLGHRDAGHLLGVSFQRAQQLEKLPEMRASKKR